MHEAAYIDDDEAAPAASGAPGYQALHARAAYAVFSPAMPDYAPELTEPQKRRAEGKTRKAIVDGCVVRFLRLSPSCQAHAKWQAVWQQTYMHEAEAMEAAHIWQARLKIQPYGFMEAL